MVDRIEQSRPGEPTRLRDSGVVVAVVPGHRNGDGTWAPPRIERRPLLAGGHRLLDRVDLHPADPSPHAGELGLEGEWFQATIVTWSRAHEDAPQERKQVTELICAPAQS